MHLVAKTIADGVVGNKRTAILPVLARGLRASSTGLCVRKRSLTRMTIRSVMMTVLAVFFRSGVPVLEGGVTMRWLTSFKAGLVLMGVCCVTWSVLGTHSAAVADAEAARQFGGLCPKYKAGACGKA